MTILENVMAGRLYGSQPILSKSEARIQAQKILEFIGFGGKHELMANSLSLVDRKRLELGRSLATKPKLLLLDEIMAGLNPVEIEATMRLIEQIRDSGITIIVVEHVMKAVLGVSDRVIVLNVGEKIAEGTPEEVVTNKQVITAYLGKDFYA
jgi:branched-chain amino acid transport system ATP-binding protein